MNALAQNVNGALRKLPAWPIYIAGTLPPIWFFYLGLTGGLGAEPIRELEQRLGEIGLWMMIATLAITPIRSVTGIVLVKFRRAIGLLTFFYILLHLLVWLFLDVQIWSEVWADIVKRPYVTIGMAGFALMVPIAITSNNLSIRKLGALRWRQIHKLTYLAALLGVVHFVILVKGWQYRPLIYLAVIIVLLLMRVRWQRRQAAAGT